MKEDGERLKQEGMQRALDFAGVQWQAAALAALSVFARRRSEFTAEQFRLEFISTGGTAPTAHKCWGALFSGAARLGMICKTGRYVNAKSAKTHAHPVPIWTRVR